MKNKTKSKILATITAVSILATMVCSNVYAEEVTGTGEITSTVSVGVNVTPITITATVPTSLSIAINPNNPNPVTTVPATFANSTKIPINIEFLGFKAKDGNTTKVVSNTKYSDWNALGVNDTQSNIALALVDGENKYWSPAENEQPANASTIQLGAKTTTPTSKSLNLDVKTGMAWTKATTLSYDMNIRISANVITPLVETDAKWFTFDKSTGSITKYLTGAPNEVVIPAKINGVAVTDIGASAFEDLKNITSVHIPNSVNYLSARAFYHCTSLASINIPNGVCSINDLTFDSCSSLTSINLPSSLQRIKMAAFDGCSSLTSINIPNNIIELNSSAFNNCNKLATINVDRLKDSIPKAPWGATGATVNWTYTGK